MKKFLSLLLCLTLVFALGAMFPASAGTNDITYHFKLPAGWTAATTFYHSFSGSALTGGPTIGVWDAQKTTLIDEGGGWAKITITGGINETGFSLVNWDADSSSAVNELKLFNPGVRYAGVSDAFCNITDTVGDGLGDWYKEKAMTNKITSVYFVTGSEDIAGYNWADGFSAGNYGLKLNETSADGVYSATVKSVPAGNYQFKITQDPAISGLNCAIVSGVGGNFSLSLTETMDVAFTLDMNQEGDQRVRVLIGNPEPVKENVYRPSSPVHTIVSAVPEEEENPDTGAELLSGVPMLIAAAASSFGVLIFKKRG